MKIHHDISNSTLTPTTHPDLPDACPSICCVIINRVYHAPHPLFLPSGVESLWKLLVNGHPIPLPTACHHLLSHHYSRSAPAAGVPMGVANRSPTIGQAVAALPEEQPLKACCSTSHSTAGYRCR